MSRVRPSFSQAFLNRRSICSNDSFDRARIRITEIHPLLVWRQCQTIHYSYSAVFVQGVVEICIILAFSGLTLERSCDIFEYRGEETQFHADLQERGKNE